MANQKRPVRDGRGDNYTQFNVLFQSASIELPSADELNKFPPDARQTILDAFRDEQQHRHQWMVVQQSNDHELNKSQQRNVFALRRRGLTTAAALVLAAVACGTWLISIGKELWGFGFFIGSVAVLIGTAIYGHRARSVSAHVPVNKEQGSDAPQLMGE